CITMKLTFSWSETAELQSSSAREPGTIVTRRFGTATSLRLTRGLQLDLEIALNGVSAKIQPLRLIQPCRRKVETSDDVIEEAFTRSATVCRAFSLSGVA